MTAVEKWRNQRHEYAVERSVPLGGGEEPETDVVFTVVISGGEVEDVTHSHGWQLDNYLALWRDDIEGEALERFADDLSEYRELYEAEMQRRRRGE